MTEQAPLQMTASHSIADAKSSEPAEAAIPAGELEKAANVVDDNDPHLGAGDGQGPATESDTAQTRLVLRKLDIQILPWALLIYATSFVDRAAIGHARAAGLMTDLKLSDGKYGFATSIFFVFYALFEVPSNIGLRRFGARRWIPLLALLWGVCQLLTAFVHDFVTLSIVRAFLGIFEAGILPGTMALMSFMYPASAVQARYGALVACNVFCVSFGGLLAYAVCHIHSADFQGWRWLFVIEGLFTILVAIPAWFGLVSSLEEVRFLSQTQKEYLKDRIEWDKGRKDVIETGSPRRQDVWAACKDVKVWLLTVTFFGFTCPSYSIALTLPSLLKLKLHHSVIKSQILTVPVYTFAAVVILAVSILADRTNQRALIQACCSIICALAWSIGYASDRANVQYFAFFISTAASFSILPCIVALLSQNLAGQTKRATGIALLISIGGTASLLASNTAPNRDAPRFALLYKMNIAGCLLTLVGTGVTVLWLRRENRIKAEQREALKASGKVLTEEELRTDSSPYFVYRY